MAAVLHGRVDRWTQAAGGRRRRADNLIAGLIPRAQGVTDPEMAQALAERDQAMEERARHVGRPSDRGRSRAGYNVSGPRQPTPARRARWMREVSTDRRLPGPLAHHRPQRSRGKQGDTSSIEQMGQRQRALAAAARATAISSAALEQQSSFSPEVAVEAQRGVEL